MVRRHEGTVKRGGLHRIYRDSKGYHTVGRGHFIGKTVGGDAVKKISNVIGNPNWLQQGGLTDAETEKLFDYDYKRHINDLYAKLAWVKNLDEVRQAVLIDMNNNLGTTGLLNFKPTLKLIKEGNYVGASNRLKRAPWYSQTGDRSKELLKMLQTGQWQ